MIQAFLLISILFVQWIFFAKKRNKSKKHIFHLHIFQLANLICSPIVALLIISMGWEILKRKEVAIIPISSDILFFGFIFSILIVFSSISMHTTAATLWGLFVKKGKGQEKAYEANEFFHGPLSHQMGFFSSIFIAIFLLLLDLNHPANTLNNMQLFFTIILGTLIGFLQAICVIYSYFHYIKRVFLATMIGSIVALCIERMLLLNLLRFPFAVLVTSSFFSMTLMLFVSLFLTKPKNAKKKGIIYRIIFAGEYYFEE